MVTSGQAGSVFDGTAPLFLPRDTYILPALVYIHASDTRSRMCSITCDIRRWCSFHVYINRKETKLLRQDHQSHVRNISWEGLA